jgi:hypothetical protein
MATMAKPSVWRLAAVGVMAATAAGLGSARLAAAADARVAVIWNAPEGCPTPQAIQDEVDRSLAASLKDVAPVAAAVNVVAPSGDGRWRATLLVHSYGKRTERQFAAESCAALASAAAVIIALAAEGPDDGAPARAADETRPTALRPETRGAVAVDPETANPRVAWDSSGLFLVLSGLLDGGTMPRSPAVGVEGSVGGAWTSTVWRLRLIGAASFFVPQDLGPPYQLDMASGQYWMVSVSGRGCFTALISRFEIGPCLGGELDAMHATNIGGPSPPNTQYWAAPLGSAVAAYEVASTVVVYARTEVAIPSTRRSFVAETAGGKYDVYKLPSYALRAAVGVEVRFF